MKFSELKDVTTLSVVGLGSALAALTIWAPSVLAENTFLEEFVTHEILAVLVIILTITFASVANIHLSISRIQTSIQNVQDRAAIEKQFAKPLQDETRSDAWLLFWAMVVCALALIAKGEWPKNESVVSGVHAVGLVVMYLNALVLYDIYNTIFALVGVGKDAGDAAEYDDGATPKV